MSIDDSALRDPRTLRLAKKMGWSRRETLGALMDVWAICYDRVTAIVPAEDVDIAADRPGFALAMEEVGLGLLEPDGLLIKGALKRIRYLESAAESGRVGGLTRAANALQNSNGRDKTPRVASRHPQGSVNLPDTVPDPDLVPDPASALPPDEHVPRRESGGSRGRRTKKPRPTDHTPEEMASAERVLQRLSERNGVTYTSAEHFRLVIARLRDGVSEGEMRAIVAYCAEVRNWENNDEMRQYLQPSTLFGPKNISRYLDPARAKYAKQINAISKETTQPSLALVK